MRGSSEANSGLFREKVSRLIVNDDQLEILKMTIKHTLYTLREVFLPIVHGCEDADGWRVHFVELSQFDLFR